MSLEQEQRKRVEIQLFSIMQDVHKNFPPDEWLYSKFFAYFLARSVHSASPFEGLVGTTTSTHPALPHSEWLPKKFDSPYCYSGMLWRICRALEDAQPAVLKSYRLFSSGSFQATFSGIELKLVSYETALQRLCEDLYRIYQELLILRVESAYEDRSMVSRSSESFSQRVLTALLGTYALSRGDIAYAGTAFGLLSPTVSIWSWKTELVKAVCGVELSTDWGIAEPNWANEDKYELQRRQYLGEWQWPDDKEKKP